MKPCKCVGLETVTWKCNWSCIHCYFRRMPQLHQNIDTPLDQLKREMEAGLARGCDSVVLCGKGEPVLHEQIGEIIDYSSSLGLYSLIITNGAVGVDVYKDLYARGLGHLQVSVHGTGVTLDHIAERKDAGKKQLQMLKWLQREGHSWRANITIQKLNYTKLTSIVKKVVEFGAFHVSLLNFLPHYHPGNQITEVAVNQLDLIKPIEQSLEYMEGKTLATLRYFPMCLLDPKYWKYVTNAQFVLFDPWEWDYGYLSEDIEKMWAVASASAVRNGITGKPCTDCILKPHCGGWNRFYAGAYNMDGIHAITSVPSSLSHAVMARGGIFDLNPANKGNNRDPNIHTHL